MISTYETIDNNTSIKYNNLYSINGTLCFLTTYDVNIPYVKKFTTSYEWRPNIIKFNSNEELDNYVYSMQNKETIDLSVLADNLWYGNVGHGLFDVLYPIYLSLLKFGYSSEPFTFLSLEWEWKEHMMYNVIKTFTKQDLLEYPNLDKNKTYHFKTLIAGTDLAGNRVVNKEMFIYGKQWDGLYQFKKRIFEVNNISLDKPLNVNYPKVIIVNNKRFNTQDINIINDLIKRMSSVCDIKFIDWYNDYKQFEGNQIFKKQLEDLQDIDIQVSVPGTSMLYAPLLKKGAVNINLGYIEHTQTNGTRGNLKILESTKPDHLIPAYLEQSLCAGAYYTTSLYYNRYKYNNLEIESLVSIINEAISLVKNHQIIEGNVNIDAKIFKEYCKRAQDADITCSNLTSKSLQIELFVNEHPYALLPSTDLDLLRSIKNKFNYDRSYEIHLD